VFWFDPTLGKYECIANIEYKPFGARFGIAITDFENNVVRQSFKHFNDLLEKLNEALLLMCGRTADYDPDDNLYFEFKMELRRLTAEEIANAGKWYSGHKDSESDSFKKGANFQQKIFEQLVDITGMGPITHQFPGYIFKLVDLKQVRP
jgi:hypothetical protein